jgi:hypothetical protein
MRTILPLLFCLAALALSACSTLKSARLLAPAASGMVQIAPLLFVDPAMPAGQRAMLPGAIAQARQRVRLYYGSVVAEPEIIACSTEKCFQSVGGVSARAKAYGASRLLLSPRGLTVPMLAHEWSHAELYIRAGGYFKVQAFPPWFDEGLAVLVSNEPSHSEEKWQEIRTADLATPSLKELDTREKWSAAIKKYGDATTNKEQYKIVYATVGHEVRDWYRKAGKSGLAEVIEAVRQGRPFARAYQEVLSGTPLSLSPAYTSFASGADARGTRVNHKLGR